MSAYVFAMYVQRAKCPLEYRQKLALYWKDEIIKTKTLPADVMFAIEEERVIASKTLDWTKFDELCRKTKEEYIL